MGIVVVGLEKALIEDITEVALHEESGKSMDTTSSF